MCPEEQLAIRALKAGVAGYLMKEGAPIELVGAIRKAVAGDRYLSARVAEQLADHLAGNVEGPLHDRLSDREYQVLRMIASGLTVSQVAARLSLSVKTVSTYRARLLEKLEMHSNAEVMRYAIENGLMDS